MNISKLFGPNVVSIAEKEKIAALRKHNDGRMLLPILLSIIALLVVVGVARRYFSPSTTQNMVRVVGAGTDLPAGSRLNYTSLHYVDMPRKYVTKDMARSMEEFVDRVTNKFVAAGNPISATDLLPARHRFAEAIAGDKRAISLSLPTDCLVDNTIASGDRVDVIAVSGRRGQKYSYTIANDVLVISSDPKELQLSSKIRSGEKQMITLCATSADCEKLALAAGDDVKMRLVLRSPQNQKLEALTQGAGESDLLPPKARGSSVCCGAPPRSLPGVLPPALLVPPPPAETAAQLIPAPRPSATIDAKPWQVEIFQGAAREIREFAYL